ncbi:MAG: hypothetical protein F2663_03970 [Actinobacteria bacterium]|uniref:Unannotated protein n=1 Tax=freshwater metagenome TaxID=449393 RepID=A0A6J6P0R2_9ZZZZ|nr:hypothetical protein [Actinomycetota bacterium]
MSLEAALELTAQQLAKPATARRGALMATRWVEVWLAQASPRPGIHETRRVVQALCALQSDDHAGRATRFLQHVALGGEFPRHNEYGF